MRFLGTLMCWLIATTALAVAVPTAWTQQNIIGEDGYAALTEQAAHDPALQSAMASELTTRAMALINEHSGGRSSIDSATVHDAAAAFTAGPSFPPLFAQLNRAAHAWLFSEPRSGDNGEQWEVDLAPMLKDPSIQQMLNTYNVKAPTSLRVPLTVSVGELVHQGQLRPAAVWGPWARIGAVALAGVFALLTLLFARGRGRAMTALGVSALLVGAAGWAGMDVSGRYLNDALNRTTGDIRGMADAMVGQAEGSLHLWLNLTLAGGAGLVVIGVFVAMLGGLFKKKA